MLPRAFSAEYRGLIAAPGTPKAVVTPSRLQHAHGRIDGSHPRHEVLLREATCRTREMRMRAVAS